MLAFAGLTGAGDITAGSGEWLPAWARDTATDAAAVAPEARTRPTPGHEEAPEPLGAAPDATAPSGTYSFTFTRVDDGGQTVPITWSPCRPLHYVIDTGGAPADFAEGVAAAVVDVSAATGLQMVADGTVSEAATTLREPFQPDVYGDRWAPVLIRFSDSETVPNLAGRVGGIGGAQPVTDSTTGIDHLVTGFVYLDLQLLESPPINGEAAYISVLRHELGHVVGLNHVEDPQQLMYPEASGTTFQGGDLAGLAALGNGPCAPGV